MITTLLTHVKDNSHFSLIHKPGVWNPTDSREHHWASGFKLFRVRVSLPLLHRHMGHPHSHVVRVLSFSCNCFQRLLQDESLAQNFAVNLSQGHREHKSLLIGEVGIHVNLLFLFFCERKEKKSLQKQPWLVCYQQGDVPIYYSTQSVIQQPKGQNFILM